MTRPMGDSAQSFESGNTIQEESLMTSSDHQMRVPTDLWEGVLTIRLYSGARGKTTDLARSVQALTRVVGR